MMASRSRLRAPLMLGCALAALSVGQAANAQAFNATPTVRAGAVNIDRGTPGVDTVTVFSPSAIVDWRLTFSPPAPDPIVYLPAGNTGIFQNGPNNGDFVILNRIIPVGSSRIRMDGRVVSQLQGGNGGFTRGGTVIFSSPTGIIVGPTALFDVGNLMLTSLDPFVDPATDEFFTGGRIQLRGGENFPGAAIVTEPGSQFNAPRDTSWIAMVAPRVDHGGAVRVNGSAAYIAAEAVDITIDAGLFDINIVAGTTDANGVVHSGSTGGPASAAAGDNHIVYMVAVPQAQAMTMLLSGSAGFDPAVSAAVENGAIILSAGHNVSGTAFAERPTPPAAPASIRITGGLMTSDVFGQARTEIVAGGNGAGALTFAQDVSLSAFDRVQLRADGGFVTRVAGNASLSAANLRPVLFTTSPDVTGGEAAIAASAGGRVEIAGSAAVDASAAGALSEAFEIGSGTGGTALVSADNGAVDIGGALAIRATGRGVDSVGLGLTQGSAGTAGTALASAIGTGTLRVGGALAIDASGTGTPGTGDTPGAGAAGTGGTGRIEALAGGAVTLQAPASILASGTGGSVAAGAGNAGGAGQGGTAALLASSGTIDAAGAVALAADGSGGAGPTGGAGTGGQAFVETTNGRAAAAGSIAAQANGAGGAALAGRGGDGTGGAVTLSARNGSAPSLLSAGSASLISAGMGGAGASGGGGIGGAVSAVAEAGHARIRIGALAASSAGTGGAGGGNGTAGTVTAGTVAPKDPAPFTGGAEFASTTLNAIGTGGAGGGRGTGGQALLISTSTPTSVAGAASLTASGVGGTDGSGLRGPATGGEVQFSATSAAGGPAGLLDVGSATGVSAARGDAGPATVLGRWLVTANGGAVQFGTADLSATGTGTPPDPLASEIRIPNGTVSVATSGRFAGQADVRLLADGAGQLRGGALTLEAGRDLILAHANRPAGLRTIDATSITARAARDYRAPGTSVFGRDGVDIQAGRDAIIDETANLGLTQIAVGNDAAVAGPVTGASIRIAATRDLAVAPGGSVGDAATGPVSLTAGRNFTAAAGTIVRGSAVAIQAGDDALLGETRGTASVTVAAGGNVDIPAPVTAPAVQISGRDVRVAAAVTGTDIRIAAARDLGIAPGGSVGDAATGPVALQAGRDYAAAAGTVVRGGAVAIRAGGNALLGRTSGTASVAVAAGGNVDIPAAVTAPSIQIAGQDVALRASGSIGDAATNTLLVQAARDYAAAPGSAVRGANVDLRAGRNATLGATTAANQLGVTAGGLARFDAPALGRTIAVNSADIDVAAAGRIGDAATTLVSLQVQGGPATLGGASPVPGYTLSQDEAGRVRGDVVRVTAPGTVTVRDLTFAGSGAPNGIRALEIATPGTIRVDGELALASAAAGDRIGLAAGNRLEVATDAGSVRIRDGAGAPAGSLGIAAGDIWVADAVTLGRLAADPNFAGRDALLQTSAGPDQPRGFVEAGGIRLAPTRTLFVANSGTAAAYAGLTVGAGGLEIVPSGPLPAIVTAFGRRLNPDGTFTTNIPFFLAVDFNRGDAPGYTNASEFNRCLINSGRCGDAFAAVPGGSAIFTTGPFLIPPQEPPGDLIDETDVLAEPLIEEPVTSGADAMLWVGTDDDDEDEEEPQ